MRTIAITTGDEDGIGWEVTAKALLRGGARSGLRYVVYRGERASAAWSKALEKKFRRCVVGDVTEIGALPEKFNLIEVAGDGGPVDWVEEAARFCLHGVFDGMVTGPLSKTLIKKSGRGDMGHTGILARVSKRKELHMAFVGEHFNVVLATGHVPISKVSKALTAQRLTKTLELADGLRRRLPSATAAKPLGLVGLNPHAGEEGLIGREEEALFKSVLRRHRGPVKGPLVPDAAFQKPFWKNYSVYVCPYHDQGLIPFKMIHGQSSGAHLTLGLPFVRTSVDHGTAKDLFGKNRADCGSMVDALHWADVLTRRSS